MKSISHRLDEALSALEAQGLTPVTIILADDDHQKLAEIGDWPVTTTARGELRYKSTPVFKARESESGSIVGRGVNGATRRIAFGEDAR